MKDTMIGFYRPSNEEFTELWNRAMFVIDANVLLNLYRYPSKASQELLGALEKLADRLWLPYHACLEYQRNRLTVIADQKRKFYDVRNAIEETKSNLSSQINNLQLKKRHSSINIDDFIAGFEELSSKFFENLAKLEEAQKNVSDEDEIRSRIDSIFMNKVGTATFDQKELDELYKIGEIRYAAAMPPGYMDVKKEKSAETESFQYGGVCYKRKFGDLILWKQIINYAKDKGIKHLVLLTDDEKEDWWWIVDSQGKKKIGPRPELVEEIRRDGDVSSFYMYNSEQFLQFSKQYLQADISDESITQVRDIKLTKVGSGFETIQQFAFTAEQAVFEWLISQHPSYEIEHTQMGFPDFKVFDGDRRLGYEVKIFRDPRHILPRVRETIYRAHYEVAEKRFDEMTIVFVHENLEGIEEAVSLFQRHRDLPQNVRILFGILINYEDSRMPTFEPVIDFTRDKTLFDEV